MDGCIAPRVVPKGERAAIPEVIWHCRGWAIYEARVKVVPGNVSDFRGAADRRPKIPVGQDAPCLRLSPRCRRREQLLGRIRLWKYYRGGDLAVEAISSHWH